MNPQTLSDWASYVASLDADTLWKKARAANTLAFVESLLESGTPSSEVPEILSLFAVRLVELDVAFPDSDARYCDYAELVP